MNKLLQLLLLYVMFSFLACDNKFDEKVYRNEILALHQEMIDAHLNKDLGFFTRDIAPDYFSVGRGEIRFPQKQEITEQFTNYINNTEFTAYNDLREPIVKFSDDGSLAYLIVQVKVAGNRRFESDSLTQFDLTWAWITLYERSENKWIRLGEVSNYKP
jgi:hypothetical protein